MDLTLSDFDVFHYENPLAYSCFIPIHILPVVFITIHCHTSHTCTRVAIYVAKINILSLIANSF